MCCYTVWSSELWWFVLVVVVQLHWYLSLWQVHLAPICMPFQCVYSFICCCWFIMHSDHLSFTTKCKHEKTIARACGFSLFLCVVIDEIRSTEDGLEANINKLKFTSHHQFPFEYKWNSNISFTYHIWWYFKRFLPIFLNSSEFFQFYLWFSIFYMTIGLSFYIYSVLFLISLNYQYQNKELFWISFQNSHCIKNLIKKTCSAFSSVNKNSERRGAEKNNNQNVNIDWSQRKPEPTYHAKSDSTFFIISNQARDNVLLKDKIALNLF